MSTRGTAASGGFLAKTWLLTAKDLRVESRGRDTLPPMIAFAVAVTLLFAFALPPTARIGTALTTPIGTAPVAEVLAAFLWVTVLFAGLIGFARTFEVERNEAAMDPLLLAPLDRAGIFVSKATGNLVFIVLLQIFLVPVFLLLFGIGLGRDALLFALVILLVDLGFAAAGTLFASIAAQTRSRELILPILALPALVPLFIAAVELTADLFLGGASSALTERGWFGILIAADIVFAVVGVLGFEYVVE